MSIHFLQFIKDWKEEKKSYVIKTSGSTGTPKDIELTLAQLKYSSSQTAKSLGFHRDTKIFNCIPTDRIGGFMNWVRSIHLKLEIQTVKPTVDPMIHLAINHNYTFVSLVPYQVQAILKDEVSKGKLNRFQTVLIGGSAIHKELLSTLVAMDPVFWQSYGMTETCSHIALKNISKGEEFYTPIGDVEIGLEDSCAVLKGTITNGASLKTKDVIEIEEDGVFKLVGRIDNVINSGGVKLFPESIEDKIYKSVHGVEEGQIVVSSVPDSELGEKLILVTENLELNLDLVGFGKYERPKEVVKWDAIPKLENGKLDRREVTRKLSN